MTKDVQSVAPATSTHEVADLMRERRLSCIVVCEEDHPVGVISERDVVRLFAETLAGEPHARLARELMSRPAVTIRATQLVEEAMQVVRERGIRRLVVVQDDGCLAGLVTQTDLLRSHSFEIERHERELEQIVEARTRELEAANAQLEKLVLLDSMLGVGNRRGMERALDQLHAQADRYHRVYSVVLFDLDFFKRYNDCYGHPEADGILRRVAELLAQSVRDADSLFRYGGEELLAALPETDLEGARRAAERGRAALEALALPHRGSSLGFVSVSAGVACSLDLAGRSARHWRDVVETADGALYDAKRGGRNQVVCGPHLAAVAPKPERA